MARPKGSKNKPTLDQVRSGYAGKPASVVDAYQGALRDLENRRAELEAELADINAVLGNATNGKAKPGRKAKVAGKSGGGRRPRGQVKELVQGQLSKTEAKTAKPISEATGLSQQTVNNTLSALKKAKVIKPAKSGKGFVLA